MQQENTGKKKSLYECILRGMKDGELEAGFSLPETETPNGVRFTDGAMDGITVYHMGRTELNADGTKQMIRAVKYAAAGNVQEADAAFARLGKSFRAISIIDDLQGYILKHADTLPAGNIYQTAMHLMLHSANRESVKFGMAMQELLSPDDSAKEVIRRLGLSDEFTIFAVWNMLRWENANTEIFNLARKVHGWGRIHALEKLDPETDEIREWILLNGVDNDVMPAYSALTAWEKADVSGRLQGKLTRDEFKAVGRIISALLNEGPVPGISAVEDAEECILDYLAATCAFFLDGEDIDTIMELQNWAEENDIPAVADQCAVLLSTNACRIITAEAEKTGEEQENA